MPSEWDCAVVGAGAAGLSAALVLGRARRRTVVIDADEQSNRASPVIGGLLGYDQRQPPSCTPPAAGSCRHIPAFSIAAATYVAAVAATAASYWRWTMSGRSTAGGCSSRPACSIARQKYPA